MVYALVRRSHQHIAVFHAARRLCVFQLLKAGLEAPRIDDGSGFGCDHDTLRATILNTPLKLEDIHLPHRDYSSLGEEDAYFLSEPLSHDEATTPARLVEGHFDVKGYYSVRPCSRLELIL